MDMSILSGSQIDKGRRSRGYCSNEVTWNSSFTVQEDKASKHGQLASSQGGIVQDASSIEAGEDQRSTRLRLAARYANQILRWRQTCRYNELGLTEFAKR